MMICAAVPLSGCVKPAVEDRGPYFCDVEEMRVFSQAEVDARISVGPTNFRKDLKTNETGKAHCGWGI